MKQGGTVYVKDNIVLPESQIKSLSWYSDALNNPNIINIGCFDTNRVRLTGTDHHRNQLVLVTALAPNMSTDRSGEIEVIAFFTESQASDVINSQNRANDYEQSVILDSNGQVLFGDMGNEALLYLSGFRKDICHGFLRNTQPKLHYPYRRKGLVRCCQE